MSFGSQTPSCGEVCIDEAILDSACGYQYSCLCRDDTYIQAFRECVLSDCDTQDQASWKQIGEALCKEFGVTFTLAATATSTPSQPIVAASTASAAASVLTSNPGPHTFQAASSSASSATAMVVISSAANVSPGTTTGNNAIPTFSPSSPGTTAGSNAAPSFSPSSPSTISGGSGLSTGAEVGIAFGAFLIVLAMAIAIGLFIKHRRHRQPHDLPPETANSTVHETRNGEAPPPNQDVKSGTVPVVAVTASPPELSGTNQPSGREAAYEKPPAVPELPPEHRSPPPPWSSPVRFAATEVSPTPSTGNPSAHELSPTTSPPHAELTAIVPSEISASPRPTPAHLASPQSRGVQEVEGTAMSFSAAPLPSELGSMDFPTYHELSSLPADQGGSAAQELSSGQVQSGGVPVSVTGTGMGMSAEDAAKQEAELEQMKQEIEQVRKEKESVQRLRALEEREAELSRSIVARELAKGGSGGS